MITDNFKYKILKSIKDSIYCFSYNVDGEKKEKLPHNIELGEKTIKVDLLLDSSDYGIVDNVKLLDIDRSVLFEANSIYNKNNSMGVYIRFEIKDILEVS